MIIRDVIDLIQWAFLRIMLYQTQFIDHAVIGYHPDIRFPGIISPDKIKKGKEGEYPAIMHKTNKKGKDKTNYDHQRRAYQGNPGRISDKQYFFPFLKWRSHRIYFRNIIIILFIESKHRQKSLLGYFDIPNLPHAFLAFFLLF